MNNRTIKISYSLEEVLLKSALVSGKAHNSDEFPTTIYCGPMDLNEIHESLFYMIRAIFKLLKDEMELPIEECDNFLFSAMTEALVKERNVMAASKKSDLYQIIKRYK